ncbi:glycerol-3-phosphate 1-O-acyltransferase PlsY [Aurantibacillus circumpalustris]|uniref:glycerol-3-phosphate 1-O-acyltransferase PlsY n=1 Tax=Aurantibacillus circumpalustris TaxID=3036359 RepID=UPI00295BB985|nr:glycerol-3-phosphate 1-O-acyltransferase PlsY [Aurantibacillus circumpalustris]
MIIFFVLLAYLLGSIPNSVWIGKSFYNIDVREFGSGNAGATNTFRVLGKKAGIPVLIFDILKGTLAVALAYLSEFDVNSNEFIDFQLGLGVAALIGHIFPVFAGFRGGKGVATILGIVVCILPLACSLSLLVFLLVLTLSRIVSLSSMLAGISFPIFLNLLLGNTNPILTVFSIIVAVLLIITHRKNIQRLIKKEETKVRLFPLRHK